MQIYQVGRWHEIVIKLVYKYSFMKSPKNAITIVTAGVIIFTILCNSRLNIPTSFLIAFLLVLHVGLIWMVFTILKHGKPSNHTFDDRMYDDMNFRR
jgi:hypothetical protein